MIYVSEENFRAKKMNKQKKTWKNVLYFRKWNFLALKNLVKLPLEKLDASATIWLYWSIQFFNSSQIYPLIDRLLLTQLVRPSGVSYHLLFSACVTYGMLYHAIAYPVLQAGDFHRVANILTMCLCSHS